MFETIPKLAEDLEALSEPARLRLLEVLYLRRGQPTHVELLAQLTDMRSAVCSHHLKKLAAGGFVSRSQQGQYVLYDALPERLAEVLGEIRSLTKGLSDETRRDEGTQPAEDSDLWPPRNVEDQLRADSGEAGSGH